MNLVICIDGTNNEFGSDNTNVVRLFQSLDIKDGVQHAYYTTGVGTFTATPTLTSVGRLTQKMMGLGFGLGLSKTLFDCYQFLMERYQEGDKIFLYGFSRGAYAARALAGLIHYCGLLRRDHVNLISSALHFYTTREKLAVVGAFRKTFCRSCEVHFLGAWDTVTSVGWVWDPIKLPHTTTNPSVHAVRHAVSIDERRAFFRQNLWTQTPDQDVKEVWFAGVHSDIGGGYPLRDSGLSLLALEWMMVESARQGLVLDPARSRAALEADCVPDAAAKTHNSLWPSFWPVAEIFPKLAYRRELNFSLPRINFFRRRGIKDGITIHESVETRMQKGYRPKNLPPLYSVETESTLGTLD